MKDRTETGPDRSEGDSNLSPYRRQWAERGVDAAGREMLEEDARYFLRQALSTPCLAAVRSAEGIWIEDTAGHRYMDFHGNNVHHIGYGHRRLIEAVKRALPESEGAFCAAAVEAALALIEADDIDVVALGPGLSRRPAAQAFVQQPLPQLDRPLVLDADGLQDVSIEAIPGKLSDHYDPRHRVLRLSPDVHDGSSLASIGVAAHEMGHALQHAPGYAPLAFRSAFLPVAAFSSRAWTWLFFIGMILGVSPLGKGFMLAAMRDPEAALAAHRNGMKDAINAGDYSGAHVLMFFVALGLVRVNRRDEVPGVMAEAENLLTLLPNKKTEATVQLVGLILAALDGEEIDVLERRLEHAALARILRENQHLANLLNGAMSLAEGARGDLDGAQRRRDAQDEDIAAGFFGESVLWAELGIALAAAAHGDLDEARAHAQAGRSWEQGAGLVTSEVNVVLTLIDAVAAGQHGDHDRARVLIDEALSTPSLLTALLQNSVAVMRLMDTATTL